MNYIHIKYRLDFNTVMTKYKSNWEIHMWDLFKEHTCYIPDENCFISLQRAKEKNFILII